MADINAILAAVNGSDLDPVIKDILIRDLKKFGMNDFLKEQILAYCDKAAEILEEKLAKTS